MTRTEQLIAELQHHQQQLDGQRRRNMQWNGQPNGQVTFYGDGTWTKCKISTFGKSCALCHRVFQPGDAAEKVIFLADRGAYMQLYHLSCAVLRRVAGELEVFESAEKAARWAEDEGCTQCNMDPWQCKRNPLDCRKCIELLRLSCVRKEKGEEEEEED